MDVVVLLLLAALLQDPVSSTLYGSRFLKGEVGGSITHQCFYSTTPANKHDRKYWCKTAGNGACYTVISTTGYTSQHHTGRVALQDLPQNGTFMVTMRELKKSDTGIYRCGIGTSNRDLYVRLNLTVLADVGELGTTELIQGELHGSVTILCPPGDPQGSQRRFWCKLGRISCTLIADSEGFVAKSYQGRISITPKESSGAFKILINDLKQEDSGLYQCGTGRLRGWDGPRVVVLQVTAGTTGGNAGLEVPGVFKTTLALPEPSVGLQQGGRRGTGGPGHQLLGEQRIPEPTRKKTNKKYQAVCRSNLEWNVRKMIPLVFIFLLSFLPAHSASSRYPTKPAISSPVFGPREVYGLLGGAVTVKCFYPPSSVNRHDRKYWCRQTGRGCRTIISSSGYVAAGYEDKISLTDYPDAENFQINVTQLAAADTGTYQCGVGINGRGLSHKVNLEVSEGPHVPEGAELYYVKLQSTLTMSCNFGKDTERERKFLCKVGKNGCYDIVDSRGKVDEDFEGRILLSNEKAPGAFSVVITQTGWEDSGLYLCGFGIYGVKGETKELDVHVYEETSAPQGKPTVLGIKGSSATFECHYNPLKKSSSKYWCKWRQNGCAWIIGNDGTVSPPYEGRVAMYDNPANKTLTIILTQLSSGDEGYYWCMTDEEREQQSSTQLKVMDGEPGLTGEKDVEAQVGSQVNLICHYPCKYYSYEKYWCKWDSPSCTSIPASDQSHPGPNVTCDTDNKTLILSFASVAESDQGWYWCGVKHKGILGETMAVNLRVTGGSSSDHSLELLDVDTHNLTEPPSQAKGGLNPQGRASSDAGVQSAAGSESSDDQSQGPNTIALIVGPVGAVLLVLATAFAIFKYRQLKRSDLVSVGSYRTNISMSDFESVKECGANNDACTKESQETQLGGDEFITTAPTPESAAETKKAKRSSKEDADLAYSAFLLTSGTIAQGGPGGPGAAPELSPPSWEGQV